MGLSRAQTKTIKTKTEHACPSVVNKDNWINNHEGTDKYTFAVQKIGTDIVVTRTDSTSGWDMHLTFQCCSGKVSYIKHSNAFVLKFDIQDHFEPKSIIYF